MSTSTSIRGMLQAHRHLPSNLHCTTRGWRCFSPNSPRHSTSVPSQTKQSRVPRALRTSTPPSLTQQQHRPLRRLVFDTLRQSVSSILTSFLRMFHRFHRLSIKPFLFATITTRTIGIFPMIWLPPVWCVPILDLVPTCQVAWEAISWARTTPCLLAAWEEADKGRCLAFHCAAVRAVCNRATSPLALPEDRRRLIQSVAVGASRVNRIPIT
mmetsp:Transcript_6133/g.18176  ORF Transcript_6133/g.18176 Transcript_6133/m.18176 type:complete len:212 (+) Transcript_6133:1017-1652(+)